MPTSLASCHAQQGMPTHPSSGPTPACGLRGPFMPNVRRLTDMCTILRATPDNATTILAIQKRAFEDEARLCGNWEIPPLTEPLGAVVGHIEAATVLTASSGTQIVGSVRGLVSDKVCTIRSLSIEPGYQGRGIGSALLSAIERAHPYVTHFELITNSVMKSNVRFYQRHGYRITELRQYSDRITLAHMSKAAGVGAA